MKPETTYCICLKLILLSVFTFHFSFSFAQDAAVLSQRDLVGTARYVSLGGAMTAIGGDPSAVLANPAGLGVYRRLEVSLTLDESFIDMQQKGAANVAERVNLFTASQASFVFSYLSPYKTRGLLANNVMISYHRLATFNRTYSVGKAAEPVSLANVIAEKTENLSEESVSREGRWDDTNVGWLSLQGYDTYLINPDEANPGMWYPVLEQGQTVNSHLRVQETGYVNQYAISWGGNISNMIYLGASVNMLSLYHNQSASYYELFSNSDGCSIDNNTYVSHSGVGVNGSFGIIAHPLRWLRLGASFTTPTAVTVTTINYGTMQSTLWYTDSIGNPIRQPIASQSPMNKYVDKSLSMPLRVSAGVAFQYKNFGFLSFQYDYAHRKSIADTHTLRVGIEGVAINRFFLTAGYAFESTFAKDADMRPEILDYTTVRTDAYSQYLHYSHYASAGFGWHGDHFIINAAYRWRMQHFDIFAHELATPCNLSATTHNIILTFNFHTK